MAKKRTGLSQTLFSGINPYGDGETALTELPLRAIRPDPMQPRRLLPAELAAALSEGELSPADVMRRWLAIGSHKDARLRDLAQLADSIAQHGLINPVTVRPIGGRPGFAQEVTHLLVTGERRYWAQMQLMVEERPVHAGNDEADPAIIAVREAPEGITVRAHQLIENLVRSDINAVEKARGLWALRFELSGVPLDVIEPARDKVIPGSPAKVVIPGSPTGNTISLVPWNKVSDLLGISKRYRILLTSVLDLTPDAQALVAANGLSEKMIRPIVQKLKPFPDLQFEALHQLAGWQDDNEAGADVALSRSVAELVNHLLDARSRESEAPVKAGRIGIRQSDRTYRLRRPVSKALRLMEEIAKDGDLPLLARDLALDTKHAETLEELYKLNEQLAALLDKVYAYQQEQ